MRPLLSNRFVAPLSGILIVAGYFLLASASLRFTRYDGGAAFVWLAGPFLFAGLTAVPRRQRIALALSCLPAMALATILFGLGWKVAAPLAVANVGEAYAAAWLVRRAFPRFGHFRSAKETFWFVITAGLAVPLAVAFVGALFVHLAAHTPYWTTWRDWFTAHAVGFIAFGPPMALIFGGQVKRWVYSASRRRACEAAAILLAVAAVASATFGQGKIPLLAAPFLPMMLATLRIGRFGAIASIVILIAIGSSCSLAGIGPTTMIHGGMGLRLQVLQIYFATVVLVILPTAGELKARRQVYERLRAAEALNRLMLDHSSDIILRVTLDGIIQYVSPAIRRYEDIAPDSLVGQQLQTLVREQDRSRVMTAHRAAIQSPQEIFPVEWQSDRIKLPPRSFEAHARTIVGENGQATGVVYVVRDVTQRNLRSMELEVRANTDPLTGLVNRRVFDQALDVALDGGCGSATCLALFDLDHFKEVNDKHGHASGDLVLKRFAEILKACTREKDIAARLCPDLLVTDHLMPGMSGAQLAEELSVSCPKMPVLIVSGYAEAEDIAPNVARLTKPFRNEELAASLSALSVPAGNN